MKAIILRGKHKGEVVEISQWCNNWFSIDSKIVELATKPFSPTSLAFSDAGIREIEKHKHNGMLFEWFRVKGINRNLYPADEFGEHFEFSFARV